MEPRHVLSTSQFSAEFVERIFSAAEYFKRAPRAEYGSLLAHRILTLAFYEPSTRTSSSFQAAMLRLGGSVISLTPETSSTVKGESLQDTIKTMECYSDVIVQRHPRPGSAQEAALAAERVPVINAGDGPAEHPTQALLDAFSIREFAPKGLSPLRITLVGDLKNGRTVHSLVPLLAKLSKDIKVNYVAPESLEMPTEIVKKIQDSAIGNVVQLKHNQITDEILKDTDILYLTRVQKERFASVEEYDRVKGVFRIDAQVVKDYPLTILHPLPRTMELDPELDSDPRSCYFKQVENGMWVRMALLCYACKVDIPNIVAW